MNRCGALPNSKTVKFSRPEDARERLCNTERRHERGDLCAVGQVPLHLPLPCEPSHAPERITQSEQIDVAHHRPTAWPPVPWLQRSLANEEIPQDRSRYCDLLGIGHGAPSRDLLDGYSLQPEDR